MEKIFDIAKDSEKSWGVIAQGIDRNFEELSNEAQESNTASHISKVVSSSIMPTIIENKQVTVDGISDGVHPTALGAKAEAMRILCDIPEITQYN